jgi:hypothetical protein
MSIGLQQIASVVSDGTGLSQEQSVLLLASTVAAVSVSAVLGVVHAADALMEWDMFPIPPVPTSR